MSTLAESLGAINKPWQWIATAGGILFVWAAIALPRLAAPIHRGMPIQSLALPYDQAPQARKSVTATFVEEKVARALPQQTDAAVGRRLIRITSMSLIVQHPSEASEKITALAESLGGYLETAEGGGQNAATGSLTIRVPATRFEQARSEIRKLGLRVEGEKVDAQDVTRQYVDQDASIRNLRAEEAGYLAIMKQATTVKDMLAVSEQLSAVRGQIEQQQAEFNALSRQIETVWIAISLRTEAEEQVFGLNWRPAYQLKLALRDGLESIATYATAMATMLFYLPAVLLWVGTVLIGALASWRLMRWVGTRWFGWKISSLPAQR